MGRWTDRRVTCAPPPTVPSQPQAWRACTARWFAVRLEAQVVSGRDGPWRERRGESVHGQRGDQRERACGSCGGGRVTGRACTRGWGGAELTGTRGGARSRWRHEAAGGASDEELVRDLELDVDEVLAARVEHRSLRGHAREPVQDEPAQKQRQHRRRNQQEHPRPHAPFAALRVPLKLLEDRVHHDVVAHHPALVHDRLRRARPTRAACHPSRRPRALPCAHPSHAQGERSPHTETRTCTARPEEDGPQLLRGRRRERMRGWDMPRMQGVNETPCESSIVNLFTGSLLSLQARGDGTAKMDAIPPRPASCLNTSCTTPPPPLRQRLYSMCSMCSCVHRSASSSGIVQGHRSRH